MTADRRIETIKDVPADKVDGVMRDFTDSGATKVTRNQQADGKWTVVAEYESGAKYPASGEVAL
jgi:hypothetical protein